jgi:3-(3-hydroxy-phenyl)propionate hydroxylase
MRVFQAIGLAAEIEARTLVMRGMKFVNAQGKLLLDWSRPQSIGPQGWYPSYRFHQPYLEQSLRKGLERFPGVEVRLRNDVYALEEQGDHVLIRSEDLTNGALERVNAKYVVGCDGARSLVRRFIEAPLEDLGSHERWLVVDLQLKRPKPELPVETVQICDPSRPITMAIMVGERRRWEIMLMPGDDPAAMTRPERIWQLLAPWIRPDEAEIDRAAIYTFHSVIARGWRAGRLLLAGDSCHQTPPFMGQGMCSGIRDASNLAWKLDWVSRGRADEALLDTYERERSPHVREYIQTAIRLGSIIQTTDRAIAAKRDAEMLANPPKMESIKPSLGTGGALSEQPRLADGRLLDDVAGSRFALITSIDVPTNSELAIFRPGAGDELQAYLDRLGCAAVLIRPDRYVLGTANSSAELRALLARIPLVKEAVA